MNEKKKKKENKASPSSPQPFDPQPSQLFSITSKLLFTRSQRTDLRVGLSPPSLQKYISVLSFCRPSKCSKYLLLSVCVCVVVLFLMKTSYLVSLNRTALRASLCRPMERISSRERTYVRRKCCKCLRPSKFTKGGGIELDLCEKLKLALYADFLILCISLRYCLCVSKCTLLYKLCSFDNQYCAYGQGL